MATNNAPKLDLDFIHLRITRLQSILTYLEDQTEENKKIMEDLSVEVSVKTGSSRVDALDHTRLFAQALTEGVIEGGIVLRAQTHEFMQDNPELNEKLLLCLKKYGIKDEDWLIGQ